MDPSNALAWAIPPLQILFVDLLLGADNALAIGLACRALPAPRRKRAMAIGVVVAMALRLVMTLIASSLFSLPLVKAMAALVLGIIALNLADDDVSDFDASGDPDGKRLWVAVATIVAADTAMSIDNVVAVAAIAQGSLVWLLIGVALSLPMLGYGGLLAAQWLHKAPGLVGLGAAMLGWIAGEMAVSDALWSGWIGLNAPALAAFAPALGAGFVFLYGRLPPRRVGIELHWRRLAFVGAMIVLTLVGGACVGAVSHFGGLE
jgi:YjbE family integral membrane protein